VDALSVKREIVTMAKKESLAVKLGLRLRELRQEAEFSQERFSDAAKLDRAGYGRVERGEVDLRLSTIERLAKTLKISVSDLFDGLD
jgi:transcriptional regulator with XRE-family HTH domain